MNQDHISHLIQRYLKGTLSDTEKADLEQRLSQDAELSEEVELQRLEKQVADELIARNLREKMRRLDEQAPPISGLRLSKGFLLLVFTVLTIVLFGGIYWFSYSGEVEFSKQKSLPRDIDLQHNAKDPLNSNPEKSPPLPKGGDQVEYFIDKLNDTAHNEPTPSLSSKNDKPRTKLPAQTLKAYRQMAMAYFEPMNRLVESSMGEERIEKPGNSVLDADQHYQKGELSKAITVMQQIADEKPDASRLHLILGKLYFEAGDFPKAIAVLQPVSERNSLYASEARWNLLLSYLANYESHQANYEALMDKIIADPRHFRYDSANALRKKLKR